MKVAVLQSNYIPWKGVFDIIHDVDMFVFYDEVQYSSGGWTNRNIIKTPAGGQWLTIPVSAHLTDSIESVVLSDRKWPRKHYNAIQTNYGAAPYFKQYRDWLQYIYCEREWKTLSELNQYLLMDISCNFLGIHTEFRNSREFVSTGAKHEKLLSLLQSISADHYLSGPAAKDYIIEKDYKAAGIKLEWKDYAGYPEYPQLHGEFMHNVSILDLLFNCGSDAPYYIWGWRE